MNLENYLYNKVMPIINSWEQEDIYAISFLVYSNQANNYKGICGFPEFSIGYCTEKECNFAPPLSEERWNLTCCRQGEYTIIGPDDDDEGANNLLCWYKDNAIDDIGHEDEETMYDDNMNYIGKGPGGYYDLLLVVSNVARRLQLEGNISKHFGFIPIIVHDLDFSWYIKKQLLMQIQMVKQIILLKPLNLVLLNKINMVSAFYILLYK